MRQRALQVIPYARHVAQILRLAVAAVEAGEDAEDFCRALRRQRRIKLGEAGGVEFRIVLEAGADVAAEQRHLQRFRHVDARILEDRGDVIGPGPDHGVLEIEHADAGDVFAVGEP